MWTVLLVEDEMFVRESIKQIVNWEDAGFTVIGEASNGLEAFQFIEIHQPDLVICDIMMPVMDGIELLKKVRANGWTNRFLMLTANTEFEHARQAVEFGASNYILKLSMSVDSLVSSLGKVKDELDHDLKQKYAGIKDIYSSCWPIVSSTNRKSASLDRIAKNSLAKLEHEYVLIVALLQEEDTLTKDDIKQLELVETRHSLIHSFSSKGVTTFFFWSKSKPILHKKNLKSNKHPFVYSRITKGSELIHSWKQVINTLITFWYERQAPTSLKVREVVEEQEYTFPWELERQLFTVFEQKKISECQVIINELWNYMDTHSFPIEEVKRIARWVDQTFVKMANANTGHEEAIDQAISHTDLRNLMCDNITKYIQLLISNGSMITDHPDINKVIEYISINYQQNITVKLLAKYIGMDENYLSGLFKKKTGESLIHYIHRIRIQYAEKLLTHHVDLSISDIAEKVGFMNDNYFIKIFKRITKETPSQYRRKRLNVNQTRRVDADEFA